MRKGSLYLEHRFDDLITASRSSRQERLARANGIIERLIRWPQLVLEFLDLVGSEEGVNEDDGHSGEVMREHEPG